MKQYIVAINCFKEGLLLKKDSALYNNLAISYLKVIDYWKYIEFYNEALLLNPKDYIQLNNKGEALKNIEQYDETLKYMERCEEAIEKFDISTNLDNQYVAAFYNYGITLNYMGEYYETIENFLINKLN